LSRLVKLAMVLGLVASPCACATAAALASITISPAKVFGLSDHIGSIEPGKDTDIVAWRGDPLEPLSAPTAVLVKGVDEPQRDRYMPGASPTLAE